MKFKNCFIEKVLNLMMEIMKPPRKFYAHIFKLIEEISIIIEKSCTKKIENSKKLISSINSDEGIKNLTKEVDSYSEDNI
jgi:hypothetical protein